MTKEEMKEELRRASEQAAVKARQETAAQRAKVEGRLKLQPIADKLKTEGKQ